MLSSHIPDSPEIPPSATAHELFRGFSFVNPLLIPEEGNKDSTFSSCLVSGRMVDALLAKVNYMYFDFPSSFTH